MSDIMKFCAQTEHCTQDVEHKLVSWNVPEDEIETILDKLREEKFLDDTRYVNSYVSEKWNLQHWGKIKIRHQLEQKNLPEALIHSALSRLENENYISELNKQLLAKQKEIGHLEPATLAGRLSVFAQGRGFEEELVLAWLEQNGFEI